MPIPSTVCPRISLPCTYPSCECAVSYMPAPDPCPRKFLDHSVPNLRPRTVTKTTATPTSLPLPRSWMANFVCERFTAYHSALLLPGNDALHFWKGRPSAVVSGNMVYFYHTESSNEQAMVNALLTGAPHMRVAARDFDFVLGQTLMRAGMPLTYTAEEKVDG